MNHPKILLVGCGHMGRAMLGGWMSAGIPADSITILQPSMDAAQTLGERYGVEVVASLTGLSHSHFPDIIIFAVKPDVLVRIAARYTERWLQERHPLFISIAAGKELSFLEEQLGEETAIIRAMPNTPVKLCRGITVLCANRQATGQQREMAEKLFAALGTALWVDDEKNMDAVTAISGSGPAYVYYFMECLIAAAQENGIDDNMARLLVAHTLRGAAEMVLAAPEITLQELREQVTSKGGTTEAGLKTLLQDEMVAQQIKKAVAAAIARAGELASLSQ